MTTVPMIVWRGLSMGGHNRHDILNASDEDVEDISHVTRPSGHQWLLVYHAGEFMQRPLTPVRPRRARQLSAASSLVSSGLSASIDASQSAAAAPKRKHSDAQHRNRVVDGFKHAVAAIR
jgi:hypothetical protein